MRVRTGRRSMQSRVVEPGHLGRKFSQRPSGVRVHPLPNNHPLAAGLLLDLGRWRHTNDAGRAPAPHPVWMFRLWGPTPRSGDRARPLYVIRQPRH
jgi:hypothetical protein